MIDLQKIHNEVHKVLGDNNKVKTYEHVLAVAETSEKIAMQYSLDKNICVASALLHDISAVINPNEMLEYAITHDWYIDEAELKYPFILHQRLSEVMAREQFKIEDERIISAISCHSTLKDNPSDYDMALFIADKLSWDMDGQPPFYDLLNRKLEISLEDASLAYINYILDNDMILYPHKWFLEAKEYFEKSEISNSIAYCGLICHLCHFTDSCDGCRSNNNCFGSRNSPEGCYQYDCCTEKGIEGCWQCDGAPCDKGMFSESHDLRLRAFIHYMKEHSKEQLAERIYHNMQKSIFYGHNRDYDNLASEEDVIKKLEGL
jgi:putative nucleotidyltransferase with HDIG domain